MPRAVVERRGDKGVSSAQRGQLRARSIGATPPRRKIDTLRRFTAGSAAQPC